MVCSTCKLIKEKTQICLKWITIVKKTQHIVKIFYMGIVFITLKERNTKRFVQNWHLPKSTSTEWSWFFFIEFVFLSLLSMQLDYYNTSIQRVFDQIKDRNSHSLYAHKLYFNARKLYLKWKKLQNVCYIYNAFKFCGIFSTFSN